MEQTITKAKLLKGDKVEIDFLKQAAGAKAVECTEKTKNPPHKDFVDALAGLNIHAALIGEFVPLVNVPDIFHPDQLIIDKFHVSGISISLPDEDDEGIIITAQKTLNSGKKLGFNTPIIRSNDTGETAYQYMDELMEQVGKVIKEAREYLSGKYAADPQIDIPGLGDEDEGK